MAKSPPGQAKPAPTAARPQPNSWRLPKVWSVAVNGMADGVGMSVCLACQGPLSVRDILYAGFIGRPSSGCSVEKLLFWRPWHWLAQAQVPSCRKDAMEPRAQLQWAAMHVLSDPKEA
jgi:hypothetical protein